MNSYICLDSSVLIKLLVLEDNSDKAAALMQRVVGNSQTVVLPSFSWAEVGSVLRKKVSRKIISPEQSEIAWEAFNSLGILNFINDSIVMRAAWHIAAREKLPTIYDAAYLAVAEIISRQSNEVCEFWTADEALINAVKGIDYIFNINSY